MRRSAAVLLVSAVVPALLVVPTVGPVAADPHPVSPRLSTIDLAGVDATSWAEELNNPAAADPDVVRAVGTSPLVFTARLDTAAFSLVGVTWDTVQPTPVNADDLRVTVRTHSQQVWQPWATLVTDSGDRPAEGEGVQPVDGADGVFRPARAGTSPLFAGPSDGVQVRVDSAAGQAPVGLRVDLIDPGTSEADSRLQATPPSAAHAAAGMPSVITRAQWGAVESLRNSGPTYEPRVKVAFVHHTATSNTYTKDQAAAAVRSVYAYDTNSLGWSDIAYNVLVDKFGQVFEGRYGGLDRAVRSGATGGFNAESWSVSALGNYSTSDVTTALVSSISAVLAWKLGISHGDPGGTASLTAANGSGTTAKYPDGTKVNFAVISGHRDAGATACPGTALFAKLPAIRTSVDSLMGAQLYNASAAPLVVPKLETSPVRLKASTMTAQDWRLEIKKQGTSTVLRTYQGSAAKDGLIDQSWDLKDSAGQKVSAGTYTVTLQSWNATTAAVPVAVNVGLFADADTYPRPADGVFRLEGRGYGHGHGMSQFGAEGAARKGLTRAQILAFYYPGTTVSTAPATQTMRVGLSAGVRSSGSGPDVRIRPTAGLQVTEGTTVKVLPTTIAGSTVTVWRTLLASGKLGLYGWTGAAYQPLTGWTGRSGPFRFTTAPTASTTSRVTLVRASGSEIVYRGVIEARRSAASDGLFAVSEVLVDDYVKSVVSAEMPGGWTDTAYQAQAVAARSYGLFKRAAAVSAGSSWHSCDTTSCQVYNGYSGETSPESKAATATAGQYLAYNGAPIFSEFGSANGGWSAASNKPYLVAKADPYDGVVTGTANWGHAWTKDVSATSIQSAYPSIGSLDRIVVTDRVGAGEWGGRITSLRLEGSKTDLTVSGTSFRSALGLKSEWFRAAQAAPAPPPVVIPPGPPAPSGVVPTAVRTVEVQSTDRAATLSWEAPSSSGSSTVSGYQVTLSPGGRSLSLPSGARSVILDGLVNGRTYSVAVVARNAVGGSTAVTASVVPGSPFGYQVSLPATSLWTGDLAASTGQVIDVLGTAGVPSGSVSGVLLRTTATSTEGVEGWLKVGTTGAWPTVAQQTVPAGGSSINVVLVQPGTSGTVTVLASTAVGLVVEVVGYQTLNGAVGQRLVSVTPTWAGSGSVTSTVPLSFMIAGTAGIRAGVPAVLLQATVSAGLTAATVRLSPDGSTALAVPVVTVPPGATRTVPVVAQLAADGTLRVLASGVGVRVSLDVTGYYLGDDGLAASGRTRVLDPTRVFSTQGATGTDQAPAAGSTITVPLLGLGGVPISGVSAVILNVIAWAPTTTGALTVYPAGGQRPASVAVSYDASSTVRTTVVAKVGAKGSVQVYLPAGGTHVLIDVAGYVTN